jgi:DNA-binding XRE family transcriptional regulator
MAVVLGYLNPNSVSDLERGVKRPLGPLRRLLDHLSFTGRFAASTSSPREWTAAEIRALRARRRLSQDDLADMLGYAFGESVSELERGVNPPSGAVCRLLDLVDSGELRPE